MKRSSTAADAIPLSRAAIALKRDADAVRRMVQRGDLAGGQDAKGRWYVNRRALDRLIAGRAA